MATPTLHAKVVGGVIVARELKDPDLIAQSKTDIDGGPKWRPIVEIGKDDPVGVDEIKEGPVEVIEVTRVTLTWTVRAMTAQEISDRDTVIKQSAIIDGLLSVAIIEIKLVDKLIADAVISANDFDAETKAEFLDLKAKVQALRP